MNEHHMRYICAIADAGSIQKASALMNKNSSTITRGLKSREDELGTVLFKRTRSRLIPTPEGEMVIGLVQEILDRLDGINAWVKEQKGAIDSIKAWTIHEWTEKRDPVSAVHSGMEKHF